VTLEEAREFYEHLQWCVEFEPNVNEAKSEYRRAASNTREKS
jgi:hypothetical protein